MGIDIKKIKRNLKILGKKRMKPIKIGKKSKKKVIKKVIIKYVGKKPSKKYNEIKSIMEQESSFF